VLAYRRCKRQYGYYNELDFAPNHVTQLFFGRVVHETLDRAHRHYAGEIEDVQEGTIPTNDEIATYFREVAEALDNEHVEARGMLADTIDPRTGEGIRTATLPFRTASGSTSSHVPTSFFAKALRRRVQNRGLC
jgi:hypothetical protein